MRTTRTDNILKISGFTEREPGVFLNNNETQKIVLAPDGIYGYTVNGGGAMSDYLEMHLNFIPGDSDQDGLFLTYVLKRVFFL